MITSRSLALFTVLSFIIGSGLFWLVELNQTRRLKSAIEASCAAATSYLQIGSYRPAQEIIAASVQVVDPTLRAEFQSRQKQALLTRSCQIPGRPDQTFDIYIYADKGLRQARLSRFGLSLLSSALFVLLIMTLIQASARAVRAQINSALEQAVGLKRKAQASPWTHLLENLPALSHTRESLTQLSQRIEGETAKVFGLELALSHRRAIAKYVHDIRSPIGALQILLQKKSVEFSLDEAALLKAIVERLVSIPNLILDVEKTSMLNERERSGAQLPVQELALVWELVVERLALSSKGQIQQNLSGIDKVDASQALPLSAVQFDRLLSNLCENAKAAGATRIELNGYLAHNSFEIQVSDNGPGGLNQDLTAPPPPPGKKIGLGLEIVREIIATSQGQFKVTSNRGQGTKVSVHWQLHGR